MKQYGLILIFFLQFTVSVYPQFGIDQNLVKITTYKSSDKSYKGSELKIAVAVAVGETWHINSHTPNDEFLIPTNLKINSDNGFVFNKVIYPPDKEYNFGFSDQPVVVYEGKFIIGAALLVPGSISPGDYQVELELEYQACNDAACMPPTSIKDTINVSVVDISNPVNEINTEIFSLIGFSDQQPTTKSNEDSIASTLESSGLILSIIFVFIGGLALNLTPCVYPLIPITIGYFGGQSEGRTSRLFILGLLYVLGMALTYSVVGIVTALSGAIFGALLQNPIVIIVIALVFVTLSLSMFGLYELKMPDTLVAKAGSAKSGIFGAFFMGLTLGIVAAPCIGPFVLGLLTYVAAKGDVFYGFFMFFFLAVGLGFPYLLLALFSGKIKSLPRAGFWMEGVKHIFGFILLGMAIYFIGPLLPKNVNEFALPVFILGSVLYLLIFDKMGNDVKGFRIFKYIFSIVMVTASLYFLYPSENKSLEWNYYSDDLYNEAVSNNQKIIIDFYADWCIPCKELDALTFSDQRVIDESKNFSAFKIDMTKTMSDETERIRNKFNIIGMPTVLIFNSRGIELERLTGFVNADEFLDIIKNID